MLKKMKIRMKLLVSFGIIVLVTLILSLLALTGLKISNKDLDDFIAHAYAADGAINECRIQTNIAARHIREMALDKETTNDKMHKEKIDASIATLEEQIAILESTYMEKDNLVADYKKACQEWIDTGLEIVGLIESRQQDKAVSMILTECMPKLEQLVTLAKDINVVTDQATDDALAKNESITNIASLIVLGLLIGAIVLSIVIAAVVTRSIENPLKEVEEAAIGMSKGILSTQIPYEGKDEVGILAEKLRLSMKTLQIYISDIDRAMKQMANGDFNIAPSQPFIGDFKEIEDSFITFSLQMSQTLREINQSSDFVAAGSDQVSDGAQILSQGATEQASSIEELTASISEISQQVNESAIYASEASDRADQVGGDIVQSKEQMDNMVNAMADISTRSQEIQKIIKAIDDIAFQTNILALNAAVEAARAGAAGKGFAVVADEVRSLASKSAEAAKNTATLIAASIEAVNKGAKLADETAHTLTNVVDGAQEMTGKIDLIAESANRQAESVNQVTIGIGQISSVVQTNSATAEESAAASEELSSQAQILKDLVRQFKLR